MDEKKKVYVETSVISNLTARPSHDIFDLARQMECRYMLNGTFFTLSFSKPR